MPELLVDRIPRLEQEIAQAEAQRALVAQGRAVIDAWRDGRRVRYQVPTLAELEDHIRALKNVTYNEPYFPGHFPYRPVMPGVIMIEALAQTAGILAFVTAGVVPDEHTRFFFVGIDEARFRRPVEPGDQLILTAKLTRQVRGIWKFSAAAYVGDVEAASAELMVAPETGKGQG